IIAANPTLQAVQLAPNGVITKMYPVHGNEKAIGLDLFKDNGPNAIEARKAIRLKKIYFQGPLNLTQGGKGVVGRLPVYINNKFWGFSAIVIKFDQLLKIAGIENYSQEYYQFQFSKFNP